MQAYAQNMMNSAWNTYGMATIQGLSSRGINYGGTDMSSCESSLFTDLC